MWRAPPTRRRCGEARRVCGAGRSRDADRRLCLRPPHDRGIAEARLAGRCASTSATAFRARARTAQGGGARQAGRRAEGLSDHRRRPGLRRVAGGGARVARAQSAARAGASSAGAGNGACRPPMREALRTANARRLLRRAAVIVTSPSTATLLTDDYDVPPEHHHRARPGHRSRARPRRAAATASCGCSRSARWCRARAIDVLIAALAPLGDSAVAADDCRRPHARRRRRRRSSMPISRATASPTRIDVLGALPAERLAALYARPICSCWPRVSKATAWPIAEALAHGLPVVGTTAGAIPDTVPPDAGVLVEPNDVKALTRTLRMLIENPKERQWFASARAQPRAALPTWEESGQAPRRRDRGADMSFQRGLAGTARALRSPRPQRRGARRGGRGARRPAIGHDRRSRLRHRLDVSRASPAASRPGRAGGWSTTISACWRARRSRRRLTSTSRPSRSISAAISRRRSTARSIWSRPRRCSISSRTNGCSGSWSKSRRGGCRSMRR